MSEASDELRTWQRNLYVSTAMVFVVFAGFAFVLPFLTLFVREIGVQSLEAATTWAGVLIGISPLLAGLMAPVWGKLAERHGHRRMAIRALVVYIVLLVLSAFVRNVWELFALRVGVGLFGGIGPLGLAMATAGAPREETGRAVGLNQSAQILAAAVGPLCGGLIADFIGTRAAFLFTASFCGIALILLVSLYREAPLTVPVPGSAPQPQLRDLLAIPKVVPMLVILFIVNFVGRSFTPILAPHLLLLGIPQARISVATGGLISLYSIAAAASAISLGRATKRYPAGRLLAMSLLLGALVVLPMALVQSAVPIFALALLLGLVSGGALTLSYTIGGLLIPLERRTSAFGLFAGVALVGGAVAPTVAGALAHLNLKAIYPVNAVLFAGLGLAVAASMWRRE